jgi:hypothetical protein
VGSHQGATSGPACGMMLNFQILISNDPSACHIISGSKIHPDFTKSIR